MAHKLRNLLQRVTNRAEFIELAETRSERAEHTILLMNHVAEAAAEIARLDDLAEREERRR